MKERKQFVCNDWSMLGVPRMRDFKRDWEERKEKQLKKKRKGTG